MNLIKRLFCTHSYEFVRNIYGDEIIVRGWKRSVWRCSKCGKARVMGKHLGCPTKHGYLRLSLDGKSHYLHRLAWVYVHGVWPEMHIDHINGQVDDNRIANLRDVDRCTNLQNRHHAQTNSRTGLLGVCDRGNRFCARMLQNGRQVQLGSFPTPELAHAAYLEARRKHYKGNTL